MAQIKVNMTYGASGTLPAVSGANLTTLNGSNISSGTVADARISALTASKLTGALPAISGASLTTLNATNISSGTLNAARYSGGIILQAVMANTTGSTSTTGTSYTTTDLTATITPASSSNKVLVLISMGAHIQNSGTLAYPQFSLRRDTNTELAYKKISIRADSASNVQSGHVTVFTYLDSPSTTSSMPYRVDMKNDSSYGGTIHVNSGAKSTIVLLEIAG